MGAPPTGPMAPRPTGYTPGPARLPYPPPMVPRPPMNMQPQPVKSTGVAALLSFLIPGAGQMYAGRVGRGLLWLFGTMVGSVFIFPGLAMYIAQIFDAAHVANVENIKTAQWQRMQQHRALPPVPYQQPYPPGPPGQYRPPPYGQ